MKQDSSLHIKRMGNMLLFMVIITLCMPVTLLAMASARDGFKEIVRLFEDEIGKSEDRKKFNSLTKYLDEQLTAVVEEVNILTPTIVEVIVKAPLAARKFHPGQFYRFQNYETDSIRVNGTTMMMEGLALTGAWVDKEKGLLSIIILKCGAAPDFAGI
jgi:hypothetical protein